MPIGVGLFLVLDFSYLLWYNGITVRDYCEP